MVGFENSPKKIVFILQQAQDADEYEKRRSDFTGNHVLISSTPDACWELEKRNLPYISIEKYTDFDELHSQGVKNYTRLDQLCSILDPLFAMRNSLIKQYGFAPARDNFFYLKIVLDTLVFRISMIRTILEREKPDLLVTFSSDTEDENGRTLGELPFINTENTFNSLLSLRGWNCEVLRIIKHVTISDKNKFLRKIYFFSKWRENFNLNQHPFVFIPLFSLKNFGLVKTIKIVLYQWRNAIRNDKFLFILRQEPSWSSAIFLLYQHGYQFVYLPHSVDKKTMETVIDPDIRKIIEEPISPITYYRGIDFSKLFLDHLLMSVKAYIALIPDLIEKTEKRIARYHPIAFIGSEKSSNVEHIYSRIAHFHDIPVISWQHGDGPFFPPMQMYVELMNSDIHLSYGPGHQKMLMDKQKNPPFCKVESVGSYNLEKITQTYPEHGTGNKILYVTAGYYYNNIYQNVHPPNDNLAWYHQKRILTVLGNSARPVDFKIWPGPFRPVFFHEFIAMNHFTNITTIWNEKTFSDLMKDCDIVICDLASTPVIEAIAANKTIFVLLRNEKYLRPESLDLLKKRIYWSNNIEDFVRMISDYIEGNILQQQPDSNNSEYLEMFGVHKLDGKVANRVLEILKRVKKSGS